MKAIYLTNGMFAIVDSEDYERLSKFKWGLLNKGEGYARRSLSKDGVWGSVLMHREVINAPKEKHVDHKNGNSFDNRKCNLRLCDRSQNMANRKTHKNNTCGLKGVRFHKSYKESSKRWEARIQFRGVSKSLGYFYTKEEAAKAYNDCAEKMHGEFCKINIL